MANRERRPIVVAITGASGAIYATRLLECLTAESAGVEVHLVVSPHGRQLLADELGLTRVTPAALVGRATDRIILYPNADLGARIASGSFRTEGMIVCPCSSHTLGAIASGLGDTLVTRAAHVTLKERRPLILLHREMPLGRIDLENMVRLDAAGATICPAAPGFYMLPESIEDLVDFVVGKLLDLMHVPHALAIRWGELSTKPPKPRPRIADG
jgi:4-hydroxy-3-polyprenylbenzoate decarboxylase